MPTTVPQNHQPQRILAKGTTYQLFAKGIFIISGYLMHIFVARYLGAALYGILGVILSLLLVVRLLAITGIGQTIAKFTADNLTGSYSVFKMVSKAHWMLSLTLATVLFVCAPYIADILFHDTQLTPYIRLSVLIIPIVSYLSVYQGSLNGMRLFGKLAISTTVFGLGRLLMVIFFVLLGFELYGVIVGLITASLLGLATAMYVYPKPNDLDAGSLSYKQMISFALSVTISFSSITLIWNIDLLATKALLRDNVLVGLYTSATTLSRIPYEFLTVFAATVLPSVALAKSLEDLDLVKKYARQTLRYVLILVLPCSVIISICAERLIVIFYSQEYQMAASSLSLLVWGYSFMGVFVIMISILNGLGKSGLSMVFASSLIPVSIFFNIFLIPRYEILGAAAATTITALVGLSVAFAYLALKQIVVINLKTFCRLCLASIAMTVVLSFSLHHSHSLSSLMITIVVSLVSYFLLLLVTMEFSYEDYDVIKNIIFSSGGR
jgi:O-antigen/teichoic acid export membrane protein